MKYLVDTDRVADYLNGNPEAVELLNALAEEGLAISIITYGEIYEGIYFGRKRDEHEQGFSEFLRGIDVLPLSPPIMQEFAQIRGELRERGQIIGDLDILIAATALYYDLTLVTRNVRHFTRVPSLRIDQQATNGN